MKFIVLSVFCFVSTLAFADQLSVESCEENQVSFTKVNAMKSYANGGIKIFEIDNVEPAGAPFGLVVTLNRGEFLSELESFCRYIPNLSGLDIATTKSSYDPSTNTLTLEMDSTRYNPESGDFEDKELRVQVVKGAKDAKGTVLADWK